MTDSIGIILLAAGLSSRMGALKPLLQLGDKTFLQHILSNPFMSRDDVAGVAVVGHEQDQVRRFILPPIQIVVNPDYRLGRMSSIQCGLRALAVSVRGAMIWPVDCPLIPHRVLVSIMNALERTDRIIIPSFQFRRGHPPLIGSAFFSEIGQMKPDEPLRDLYRSHADALIHVTVDSETILHNVNTPEDYERICAYFVENRCGDI
ncbi:MAG: nucleotidyltransferase family protein [Candidatus Omnitrophota bacterium]|jgi:CTP:molybdopterin cytidylyltransferase MocA|nr:MAG: nucleotidyltransferase family protein [Candidatus Omnitrophota bacterium]